MSDDVIRVRHDDGDVMEAANWQQQAKAPAIAALECLPLSRAMSGIDTALAADKDTGPASCFGDQQQQHDVQQPAGVGPASIRALLPSATELQKHLDSALVAPLDANGSSAAAVKLSALQLNVQKAETPLQASGSSTDGSSRESNIINWVFPPIEGGDIQPPVLESCSAADDQRHSSSSSSSSSIRRSNSYKSPVELLAAPSAGKLAIAGRRLRTGEIVMPDVIHLSDFQVSSAETSAATGMATQSGEGVNVHSAVVHSMLSCQHHVMKQ
jgi:hypothetical protein